MGVFLLISSCAVAIQTILIKVKIITYISPDDSEFFKGEILFISKEMLSNLFAEWDTANPLPDHELWTAWTVSQPGLLRDSLHKIQHNLLPGWLLSNLHEKPTQYLSHPTPRS